LTRRTAAIAATVFGALWLMGLAAYPLLESTEGRYASIAWDMAHGGGWIIPVFNDVALFSKPPLAYWAGAAALEILPDTEWAVRLPATLALVLCAWLTMRLARLLGLDRQRARWAGLMTLLSPLALVQGHMTTNDIFLWAGILLTYTSTLGKRTDPPARLLAGLGLAMGFMAKGHMILFWTVIPPVAWGFSGRGDFGPLRRLIHPVTLLTFLALAAPWFAAVLHRHPGLLGYWLSDEVAGRVLSSAHGRTGPWWYFLPLVPMLMLPWLPELVRGLRRPLTAQEHPGWRWLMILWVAVPLVIFSLSGSKRPNYLLPMVTPLTILTVAGIPAVPGRRLRIRTGGWMIVALAWPFAWGGFHLGPPTRSLVRYSQETGATLACYQVMPGSIVFYNRGPVAEFSFPRDVRFGGEIVAPDKEVSAANLLLDRGGMILTTRNRRESLEHWLGRKVRVRTEDGDFMLVGP